MQTTKMQINFTTKAKFHAELKIWSGPEDTQNKGVNYEKSIGEQIFQSMRNNSERVCQITDPDGSILTHGEVLDFGVKIALYLRKLKMTKDDVVGIIAKDSKMMLPLAVGCWLNCTPFYALSSHSDRKIISHFFGLTRPKMFFSNAENYAELVESCNHNALSPEIFIIDDCIPGAHTLEELLQTSVCIENFQPTKLQDGPDQTSIYMNTSGTTGMPKCLHVSNSRILAEYRPSKGNNNTFFTFNHLTSCLASLMNVVTVLLSGATRIVTSASAEPELLFQLISKYQISHVSVDSGLLAQMVNCFHKKPRDLKSVRTITSGRSIIPVPVIQQANNLLVGDILQIVYDVTECGYVALNKSFNKPNSVGQLLPGIRVKIIDGIGQSMNVGETGEILIHNGCAWRGYVGNAKETAANLDAAGWFHTGDLGYFDADADLYIVERKKDMLRFRCLIFSPSEIEQVIAELPDVIEVCVFGVEHDLDGYRSTAAVIKKDNSPLTELEVEQFVAAKLRHYLHLHGGVYFVHDFPRTTSGKVKRRELRDRIAQNACNK